MKGSPSFLIGMTLELTPFASEMKGSFASFDCQGIFVCNSFVDHPFSDYSSRAVVLKQNTSNKVLFLTGECVE